MSWKELCRGSGTTSVLVDSQATLLVGAVPTAIRTGRECVRGVAVFYMALEVTVLECRVAHKPLTADECLPIALRRCGPRSGMVFGWFVIEQVGV